MSHIDTLQVYEDLKESGVSEKEAKAHVKALNASFDTVVTESNLKNELLNLEHRLKMFFVYLVGGSLLLTLFMPIIKKVLHIE